MTRNFKRMGLAFAAVLALSAVVAQAAMAENHEFLATRGPTIDLTGHGTNHVFSANGVEVTCATATFKGTQTGTTVDKVRVTPTYDSPCELGGISVTVTNKADCEYEFESDTNLGNDAPVRLDCQHHTEGIVISGLGCTIYIGDTHTGSATVNQNLVGVRYANVGPANTETEDVQVTAEIENIAYETNGGFTCGLLGIPTTGNNGTYFGVTTVQGYEDGEPHTDAHQIGLRIENNTAG